MRRLPLLLFAFVVTFGLVAVGCDSTGSMVQDDEKGTVGVRFTGASSSSALTSAVADSGDTTTTSNIDSASVRITRIALVAQGDSSSQDSIVVLNEEDFTIDLMALQAGLDTLMDETEVSAGTYSQLRLITADQATVQFNDGAERDVMVASGQQTGLKVNFSPFTIGSAGDNFEIVVEWDVEDSLRGNRRGRLVITPSIRATVNAGSSGS